MIRDDEAVSTVIGAIMVMGVLGSALLYVNAFHVPRQGAALEVQGAEATEAALTDLAVALQGGSRAPSFHDIPLTAARGTPPLLAGIVLTPVRPGGSATLDLTGPRLTLSAVLDAPPNGIPLDDPIREDLGGGLMRLYILGNRTGGLSVGALTTHVGGAYSGPTEYRVEAGLLLTNRSGSSAALAGPGIFVQETGVTSFSWRIPIMAGGHHELSGGEVAQLGIRPGPESAIGGGRVHNLSIQIETANVGAWRQALSDALGPTAFVNATIFGDPDNGTLSAIVLPPAGTPAGTRAVEMHLWAVRYDTTLTLR